MAAFLVSATTLWVVGSGFTSEIESQIEFTSAHIPNHADVGRAIEHHLNWSGTPRWALGLREIEIQSVTADPKAPTRYTVRYRAH